MFTGLLPPPHHGSFSCQWYNFTFPCDQRSWHIWPNCPTDDQCQAFESQLFIISTQGQAGHFNWRHEERELRTLSGCRGGPPHPQCAEVPRPGITPAPQKQQGQILNHEATGKLPRPNIGITTLIRRKRSAVTGDVYFKTECDHSRTFPIFPPQVIIIRIKWSKGKSFLVSGSMLVS